MVYFDHSLLNMLPLHPVVPTLLLIADEWLLQSMGAPGDEQIPILTWGISVPDSLHCVQFILVDMNMMPRVCLWASTEAFQRSDTWWEPSLQGMCAAADSGHCDRAEPRMGCWAGVNKCKEIPFPCCSHCACLVYTPVNFRKGFTDVQGCGTGHHFHNWHSTRRPQFCTKLWTTGVSATNGRPTIFVRRYKQLHEYWEVILWLCIPTKCMYQSQHLARGNRIIKVLTVGFKILFTLQEVQKNKDICLSLYRNVSSLLPAPILVKGTLLQLLMYLMHFIFCQQTGSRYLVFLYCCTLEYICSQRHSLRIIRKIKFRKLPVLLLN